MRRAVYVLLAMLVAGCAHQKPDARADVPDAVVQYFDRLDAIYRSGSTPVDINTLFDLMTRDVRYLHTAYEADFNRETWYAAFSRIQSNGGYQEPTTFCSAITNSIPGDNSYAIQYAPGSVSPGGCVPDDDTRMLVVFSLREGKIARIEELW